MAAKSVSYSITEISQTTTTAVITGPSVLPLTTIFTPPSDCNRADGFEFAYSNDGTIGYNTDSEVKSSSCYPPSYAEYQKYNGNWYSPGVCPDKYEWVATSTEGPTTLAICCPPGFFTKGLMWSCTQPQSDELPGKKASMTIAYANPISVAWQSSDLQLFVPASAPIRALARQTGGSVSIVSSASFSGQSISPSHTTAAPIPATNSGTTSATSYVTPTQSGHSGFTPARVAAVGVGVGVGAASLIIIGALLFWLFRHYKLSVSARVKPAEVEEQSKKRDIYGELYMQQPVELPNSELPYEADSANYRSELEANLTGLKAWESKK